MKYHIAFYIQRDILALEIRKILSIINLYLLKILTFMQNKLIKINKEIVVNHDI